MKKKDLRTITQQSLGRPEQITKEVQKRRWLEWAQQFQMLVDYDNNKYDEFVEFVSKSSDEIFEKVYEQQNKEETLK